ncbi:hypothetical protein D3C87_1193690 [compost metagenome]
MVIISAIPFAAVVNISSAFAKAAVIVKLPKISLRRSLEITKYESTYLRNSDKPSSAWDRRRLPSKVKGVVIIATVKIPNSLAAFANTGLAPVPVPPPIPAVIKSIFVLVPNMRLISSILSIAEFSPTSGSAPAPIPSVKLIPNCTLLGIGLNSKA